MAYLAVWPSRNRHRPTTPLAATSSQIGRAAITQHQYLHYKAERKGFCMRVKEIAAGGGE